MTSINETRNMKISIENFQKLSNVDKYVSKSILKSKEFEKIIDVEIRTKRTRALSKIKKYMIEFVSELKFFF